MSCSMFRAVQGVRSFLQLPFVSLYGNRFALDKRPTESLQSTATRIWSPAKPQKAYYLEAGGLSKWVNNGDTQGYYMGYKGY